MEFTKPKLQIRSKILLSFILILSLVIGYFVFTFVNLFKKEKIQLVYELNALKLNNSSSFFENEVLHILNRLSSESELVSVSDIHPATVSYYNFNVSTVDSTLNFSREFESSPLFDKQKYLLEISKRVPDKSFYFWNFNIKQTNYFGFAIKKEAVNPDGQKTTLYQVAIVDFKKFISNLKITENSEFFIADNSRKIIFGDSQALASEQRVILESPVFLNANKVKGTVNVTKITNQEETYLASITQLKLLPITLVSYMTTQKAFVALSEVYKIAALVGLAAFVISFMLVGFISKSITQPIVLLMKKMVSFSKGETVDTDNIVSSDEVGALASVFTEMIFDLNRSKEDLLELNRDLENKVQERTRELEELTIKDALTGAYNRRFFNQKVEQEIERAKRAGDNVGILYLDIDHFKKYNDQNGHPEGDQLLINFVKLVQGSIRTTDFFCRLGGEEFCIICTPTTIEGIQIFAENVRSLIYKTDFKFGEKQPMGRLSCSIGLSLFPDFASNPDELVKSADEALYHAKQNGRNQWRLAEKVEAKVAG